MQQIDYRQIGTRFPVRDRKGLEHHPARLRDGLELEQQARFADPGLRHRRHDLSVPSFGVLRRMLHRLHLALPPDELRQATARRTLQAGAQRPQPGYLVNLDRLADAFDFGWTQTVEEKVALTELPDLFGRCDGTDWRQHLHPRGEVGGMPYRRVLGMRLAGLDRTHHHLPRIHSDTRL